MKVKLLSSDRHMFMQTSMMIQYHGESIPVMLRSLLKFVLALVLVLDGESFGETYKHILEVIIFQFLGTMKIYSCFLYLRWTTVCIFQMLAVCKLIYHSHGLLTHYSRPSKSKALMLIIPFVQIK